MKNKLFLPLLSLALSLLAIFGYQWASSGSPPDVEKFLSSAQCETKDGTITITPTAGQIQALNGTLGATTSITALGNYGQHVWFQSDGTNWVRIN
mgnify:CR=1 FL=1|jgi:hypothetical protein